MSYLEAMKRIEVLEARIRELTEAQKDLEREFLGR